MLEFIYLFYLRVIARNHKSSDVLIPYGLRKFELNLNFLPSL